MLDFDKKIALPHKENDVLAVGELLIDMISADYDGDFAGKTFNKFFGGAPANIAMNVTKLGGHSIVASAVGQDGLGRFLINHLKQAGMDASYIQEVDYATSMVLVTKSKKSPTPIFYREADMHLSYTPELERALMASNIMHFSCWPISRMPVRQTVEKLIDLAKKERKLICFDPNYHPMIWQKGEDGVAYIKSLIEKVDIIKPSEDDAERLFGKDTYENHIAHFLRLGAKLVIMTLGKDGAVVSNGKETVRLKSLATDVVDTTGAGDAFWSGFYTAVVKGYTIREALNLGSAVSAYKLKHEGAVVELPKLPVIKQVYGI
ncbi:carbohydrate kinase [Salipaludibacillus sp. LMS25]|jgi:fructokinase|uniref:carbohydrate kinase family protein n=1 Tax=Salipaludibacillus sp. LMS25 TaxID=2924031 RepID=UPI0020CFEF6B|nr:carbohydrate kinase [Salipaludibacillus sp. LMS25]UTR16098.1 carbohydrate kinase [Salipaludibacillus sp. LMS25]